MTTTDLSTQPPGAGSSAGPPVVLFLTAIEQTPENSTARFAELVALHRSKLQGTFTVESGPTVAGGGKVADHCRIVDGGGTPVLEFRTVDYHAGLNPKASVKGDGLKASVLQLVTALACFGRSVRLLMSARKRAKSRLAKAQLAVGAAAAVVLFVFFLLTVYAVAVALGADLPKPTETLDDALAMGMVAVFTYAFLKSRPHIEGATDIIRQVLDYARSENVVERTTNTLIEALDRLLDENPRRPVHIVGYSFGSLVALDMLFPKTSAQEPVDPRYRAGNLSLLTIGCPVDFMRLYFPDYLDARDARAPGLPWTNIFIPADVFGSNFSDVDDVSPTEEGSPGSVSIAGRTPTTLRHTQETLSWGSIVVGAKGFAMHGGYWGEPGDADCMNLVTPVLFSPIPAPVGAPVTT